MSRASFAISFILRAESKESTEKYQNPNASYLLKAVRFSTDVVEREKIVSSFWEH